MDISLSDRLGSGDCTTGYRNFLRKFLQCVVCFQFVTISTQVLISCAVSTVDYTYMYIIQKPAGHTSTALCCLGIGSSSSQLSLSAVSRLNQVLVNFLNALSLDCFLLWSCPPLLSTDCTLSCSS
jgi:hypothetical protein